MYKQLIIRMLVFCVAVAAWNTPPPVPILLSGSLQTGNGPADHGTVEIRNAFGTLIAEGEIIDGFFVSLALNWDDPNTAEIEGLSILGDRIEITVTGHEVTSNKSFNVAFEEAGQTMWVDLTGIEIIAEPDNPGNSGGSSGSSGSGGPARYPDIQDPENPDNQEILEQEQTIPIFPPPNKNETAPVTEAPTMTKKMKESLSQTYLIAILIIIVIIVTSINMYDKMKYGKD